MNAAAMHAPMTPSPHSPALPPGAGVCLKPEHYAAIIETPDLPAFFEIHAENYLCAGGPAHRYLEKIRSNSRLSIHGVGLSLGGTRRPELRQLAARRALLDRYQPDVFSEHLAWSSTGEEYLNDLLPLALTPETLERVASHVEETQDALGRRILIENPATYVQFDASSLSEPQFLAALAHRSGCGLLLDVNNVVVSAANHAFDPVDYLRSFPLHAVGQIHLAGHAVKRDSMGNELRVDSHDGPVQDDTWSLYADALALTGPLPTLIEWDGQIPDWQVLMTEARKAHRHLATGPALAARSA